MIKNITGKKMNKKKGYKKYGNRRKKESVDGI